MFKLWLMYFAALVLLIVAIDFMPDAARNSPYLPKIFIPVVGVSGLVGLWLFVGWLCDRRNFGRFLVGAASLATVVAIFYLEEDWRGKRAWAACKAEIEAKGIIMDWDKYVPPPVPDDQNFFTASTNILLRFKKAKTTAESAQASKCSWLLITYGTNSFPVFDNTKTNPLLVATITILPVPSAGQGEVTNGLVVKFGGPGAPQQVQGFIKKNVGESVLGSTGFRFSERQPADISPVRVFLQTDASPSITEIESLVPKDLATNLGDLRIKATGQQDTFQVLLADIKVTTAADYLKWSDQFVPALDELREALKRPYAILPGDYSRPFLMPIPNFVAMRAVAQNLAQRAQCELLLGEPDKAVREMTLLHDICRILQKPPSGKPETLVEAMINVAINGLYAATIADGFRLHAWQEPQLIALQQQLQTVNLPRFVAEAFRDDVAASAHTLEIGTPGGLERSWGNQNLDNLWQELNSPFFWLVHLAPRGWYYQNMTVCARLSENNANTFDLPNNLILPKVDEANMAKISTALSHWSLWNLWASFATPNLLKAVQTTAYNQTLVNEAQIACALERYHLAHGEYPETLDVLAPQFIESPPHDLIGGQPLHYRRNDASSNPGGVNFLLYSVGWNETDDGGVPGTSADVTKGDWVWKQ